MAGPETAFALGQPDVPNMATPDMAPMTTPAGSAPTADELATGQQTAQRSGVNLSVEQPQLNPNRAYSAQELYPRQERPWESRASGGDFIATPSAGRIPWGIIADRAAQVQKQKQELQAWMQKMFGGDKFEGQAAPEYEREYQQWAAGEDQRFKKEFADQYYGGNMNRALKALYKDPEANSMYLARMRDVKAAGIANKHYVTQAHDYLDGVRAGNINPDPEMMRTATEMVSGGLKFSGPDTPSAAQMADKGKQWEKLSSRSKLFNDQVKPRIERAQDELTKQGKIHRDPSGRLIMDEETFKNYDRLIDKTAKEWENMYGIGSEAENKSWLKANLGEYYKQDTQVLPQSPSGPAASAPDDKVWTGGVQRIENKTIENDPISGKTRVLVGLERMPLGAVVAGRQVPFKDVVAFNDGRKQVNMVVTSLDKNKDGSFQITGYDPGNVSTDTNTDDLNAMISNANAIVRSRTSTQADKDDANALVSELTAKLRRTEKTKEKLSIPLKGNEEPLNSLLAGTLQQQMQKFGVTEAPKTASTAEIKRLVGTKGQESVPEVSSQEQINSALKKAGAAKGKTYTMEDWNNASPEARTNMMKAYGASASSTSTNPAPPAPSRPKSTAPPATTQKREAPHQAAPTLASSQPKEETPVIHKAAVVRDTIQAQKMTPAATGIDAMRNRMDANIEPGTYKFKNAEEADAAQGVSQSGKAIDPDPKGFFTGGNIVESKIGDKKVFFIMDKTGMRPLSDYFEDKQSAKLVLDAFERGEILEEFLSKRSRSTQQAFEKLLNKK